MPKQRSPPKRAAQTRTRSGKAVAIFMLCLSFLPPPAGEVPQQDTAVTEPISATGERGTDPTQGRGGAAFGQMMAVTSALLFYEENRM